MFTGLPDYVVYILLLVVATIIAGRLWALGCATWHFVRDVAVPLAKVILIVVLWIVFILLVNKFELVGMDFSKVFSDVSTNVARLTQDIAAPLFA